jgi:hypothetical protein
MNSPLKNLKFLLAFALSTAITAIVCWQLPPLIANLFNLDDVYIPANWEYDKAETKFDHSAYTYITDYFLSLLTGGISICALRSCGASPLRSRVVGLMLCYCLSTLMGGLCHQFSSPYNSDFPVLWTIVVGTVTTGGGIIGSIGSALNEIAKSQPSFASRFKFVTVPEWVWILHAIGLTVFVATGGISFKRPAADIFIAGITQVPSSAYVVIVLLSNKWQAGVDSVVPEESTESSATERNTQSTLEKRQRKIIKGQLMVTVGFVFNAPLLPLYPILVTNGLTLGHTNTILHSFLAVAWGLQGFGLRHFAEAYPVGIRSVTPAVDGIELKEAATKAAPLEATVKGLS